MRAMISSAMPDNPVNLLFLLLFVAVFCAVAVYTFKPSNKARHEHDSRLPLND